MNAIARALSLRRHPFPWSDAAVLSVDGWPPLRATIVDVSATGMVLNVRETPPRGVDVMVHVRRPAGAVAIPARVLRSGGIDGIVTRVEFGSDLSAEARDAISELVRELAGGTW